MLNNIYSYTMSDNYKPFVFKLSVKDDVLNPKNIDSKSKKLILSNIIAHPNVSLGFHYFLHRTKDAMEITNNSEITTKFYYVVNPFEHKITDYKEDLTNETKKFFNLKTDEPTVLSRAFYKMWEMIYYFDLAAKKDLTYAAIAEGPGSFLQAVLKFREKYGYDLKKDKYFGVTIHPEQGKNIEMAKQFMGFYENKYPSLINIQKTYAKSKAENYKSRSDGDLTQVKTISLFKKEIAKSKKYADLVTADGGFDWNNENYQEQEAYQLILGEMIAALRVQNKDGSFVLKLFETFTMTTLKMIYILASFYEECYICKPLFSRSSNSEKYLVCKGFKYDQKKDSSKLEERITILEKILEEATSNEFVQDIFPDMELPIDYINTMRYGNIEIANKQQIMINKIVTYIKDNNYYGEKYHNYRDNQIKATKWWINTFFTEKKNKNIETLLKEVMTYNLQEEKQISKKLV